MKGLAGHLAVITGASSGIGKAIALSLAKERVSLCLVGRKLATLEAVAESLLSFTPQVRNYQADLAVDADVHQLAGHFKRDMDHIDVLVHCAGVISLGKLESAPLEDFDQQYWVNVRGPYLLTQTLLPLIKVRRGQIVFINSSQGLSAKANVGAYAATKHALKAIADSLRDEVNPEGVRVLSVFLGRTATPMQKAVCEMEDRPYHPERLLQPEDVAAVVNNALSLPATAEVIEIHMRPLMKPD